MIERLLQIRTGRDAFFAALAITAAIVVSAMALTALATIDGTSQAQAHAVKIAAWVSLAIGSMSSYWFIASFRAIVRLKDTVDRLARTDDLTGLENRRAFFEAAEREMARAQRQGEALSLLILDLDYFKRVNDTHGHRVGDLVLVAVAEVVSRSVRAGVDLVGRLGGEEFAVMLARCDLDAARRTAEGIRAAIETARVATPAGEIVTTVSIGCASVAAGDNVSAALQKADEALYAAKRGGRNRVALCAKGSGEPDFRERAERQRRDPPAYEPLKRSA